MARLFDPSLEKILKQDREYLEQTEVPIITVFGTFIEDLKEWHHKRANNTTSDIVLSRAHLSMALAVTSTVWNDPDTPEPKKAWLVDPTNFVTTKGYQSVNFTEEVGKLIARYPILKIAKDIVDQFGRKKLPILTSITPPLLYLTQNIDKPILSFHIAAGNILADAGKTVVQVVTDPHIREDYLVHANSNRFFYFVFDEKTRVELLEKAMILDKELNPERVIVTGPPVDPRVLRCRKHKHPWRSGPLHLCLTTGGLGTNKSEILAILHEMLPHLKRNSTQIKLLIYAGTHRDIYDQALKLIRDHDLTVGTVADSAAQLRLIYHPQIMDANEQLIQYGFPWAHGIITKPSGDMAYDAATSGSFLLTLKEWGEWEHNIREIFEQRGISRRANVENLYPQLQALMSAQGKAQSWIEKAMLATHQMDPMFYHGADTILKEFKKISAT